MFTICLIGGIGGTATPLPCAAGAVAEVNGSAITESALNRSVDAYFRAQRLDAGGVFNPRYFNRVKHKVLNTLIAQELLFQQASSQAVTVPAAAVAESIARDEARQINRQAFLQELHINGFNLESYRTETHKRLTVEAYLRQHIAAQVRVTQEEIAAHYDAAGEELRLPERVALRQILLRVAAGAEAAVDQQQRQRLETLRAQIEAGADFSTLAASHSDGPKAAQGGDLGLQPLAALVSPLAELVETLALGELSPVFRSGHGWHLVRVEARRPSEMPALDQIRSTLAAQLWEEKLNRTIEQHVSALREQGEINIHLEKLASAE
jgi:peptidyl-prolyl cis-trans isomerase SurA